MEQCKNICDTNHWEYEIYRDIGLSGLTLNRPNLNKMIEDIENGKINKVVASGIDRISRNNKDFSKFTEFLNTKKVEFISTSEI